MSKKVSDILNILRGFVCWNRSTRLISRQYRSHISQKERMVERTTAQKTMILLLMGRPWLLKAYCESFLYAWCSYLFLWSMSFTQVTYSRVCGQGKVIRQTFIGLQASLYVCRSLDIYGNLIRSRFVVSLVKLSHADDGTLARLESDDTSGSDEISLIMAARYREMSAGTRTEPCLRPPVIVNRPERLPRCFVPSRRIQVRDTNRPGETKRRSIANIVSLGTLSKAFLIHQMMNINGFCCSRLFSCRT